MASDEGNALARVGRWLCADRDSGRIVLVQWPNWSLWTFIVAALVGLVLPHDSRLALIVRVIGAVALAVWAADEVVRGCNPFRRVLGAAILVLLAVRWLLPLAAR